MKGAYLEVWSDMLGSLGVIVGAGIIWLTGWTWVDPLIAVAIGLWVLPRTWILLRDSVNILLEGVPNHSTRYRASLAFSERGASLHERRFRSNARPGRKPPRRIGTTARER